MFGISSAECFIRDYNDVQCVYRNDNTQRIQWSYYKSSSTDILM